MTDQYNPQCQRCGLLKDETIELCVQCDARKINAIYGAAVVLSILLLCAAAYFWPDILLWLF